MKSSLKSRTPTWSSKTAKPCKSVRFAVDDKAKHGVKEIIVPSDGFLTVQERVLGWYNGRNYQVFKMSRRNCADEVRRGGDDHAEYRTLFTKVLKACAATTELDVTGGGGWQAAPHQTEVASAHSPTATKSALILAQARFRGLERCIFPELLMSQRTAAIRAVVAFAAAATTKAQKSVESMRSSAVDEQQRLLAIAAMAQQQSLPFRRLARLQATGDALLVAIWDRLAAKAAAAAAAASTAATILEPMVLLVDSVMNSTTPKCAALDDSEETTKSTVDSDDSDRSDDDDDEVPYDEEIIDCNSENNSDNQLQATAAAALSNSFHSLIVSTSARRAKSLMQTRCSLMA
jgi:hypothetical protein